MNRQRLMELAGISSNMANPSHEPATDVPDHEAGMGHEDTPSEDPNMEIEELIHHALSSEDMDEVKDLLNQMLSLVGGGDDNGDEDMGGEMDSGMGSDMGAKDVGMDY